MSEEKKLEMVHEILRQAKEMIGLVYKPEGAIACCYKDFTDEEVREIYYAINEMCIKLSERNVFSWQKKD